MKNLILRDPRTGSVSTHTPEDFKTIVANSALKEVYVDLASAGEPPSLQRVGFISLAFTPEADSTHPHLEPEEAEPQISTPALEPTIPGEAQLALPDPSLEDLESQLNGTRGFLSRLMG